MPKYRGACLRFWTLPTRSIEHRLDQEATVLPAASAVLDKHKTLSVRIKAEKRSLIDRAGSTHGKNRTDFVLNGA